LRALARADLTRAEALAQRSSSLAPTQRASFQREVARCLEAPGAPPRGAASSTKTQILGLRKDF